MRIKVKNLLVTVSKSFRDDLRLNPFKISDIKFENSRVRLIAIKSIPKISIGDEQLGPVDENKYFEARYWVAEELVKNGFAKIVSGEDKLEMVDIQKAQIVETIQSPRHVASLPKNFYARLRKFLKNLRNESLSNPDKKAEFQKALQLAMDIVTSRINKILILSSIREKDESILKNLTFEERFLFERVYEEVNRWRNSVFDF